MRTLYLILLIHASLQLRCDKGHITAPIGSEFIITCRYDANRYLFSKKYWCRGDSRSTCEILLDSDRVAKAKARSHIIDAGRNGLFVKITDLQFDDTGMYWIGIDKMYADIMTSVDVIITEVPVSKPRLWPLSSLVNRPTCWGQQVTVRCGCTKGTSIRYAWYQHTHHKDFLLYHLSDLSLNCDTMGEDSEYYCIVSNEISSQKSDHLSVQVLMLADSSCIYVINMEDQPIYDCADRMSTTTAKTPPLTCKAATEIGKQSSHSNQTDQHWLFSEAWAEVPLWYMLLRWGSFASLLVVLLGVVLRFTKAQCNIKCSNRKRKVNHF
ncbi:hypothetical protein PAMA_021356 [Pampus argenteus]